jgi:hypothetical protein
LKATLSESFENSNDFKRTLQKVTIFRAILSVTAMTAPMVKLIMTATTAVTIATYTDNDNVNDISSSEVRITPALK